MKMTSSILDHLTFAARRLGKVLVVLEERLLLSQRYLQTATSLKTNQKR